MGKHLRWVVELCRGLNIASSSRRTYFGHHKIFLRFCEEFELDPLLINEEELCLVVAHFVMGHTVNSVPPYLSALQNLFTTAGAGPLPRGPKFLLFLRGLRRLLGPSDEVVRTRALSVQELEAILASLDRADAGDVCFGAQLVVAFMLALRTEDHTDGRMRWGDLYPQADGSVEFLLSPGKSVRRFRRVAIAAKRGPLNAMSWLASLAEFVPAAVRARRVSPLFVSFARSRDGVQRFPPVSRSAFIARFKRTVATVLGYSPALYAGYSLRRGGVTEMLMAGVPLPVVKSHVGWAPGSDAPDTYYDHAGRLQMRIATQAMGRRD